MRDVIDLTSEDDACGKHAIELGSEDDDDEDDDDDLRRAIALSLKDQHGQSADEAEDVADQPTSPKSVSTVTHEERKHLHGPSLGLAGLDRRQMELERLERLKRKRTHDSYRKAVSPPPLKRMHPDSAQISSTSSDTEISLLTRKGLPYETFLSQTSAPPFLSGKVFLTSTEMSASRISTSISLDALLKAIDADCPLRSAYLSSYIWDFDWLLPHFNTKQVKFVFGLHATNEQHRELLKQDFAGIPNVKLVFPSVGGPVRCMHSKLMLLFYEPLSASVAGKSNSRCRVVIPSANLVPFDWGVGGVMENVVFVIDLYKPAPDDRNAAISARMDSAFKSNLIQFLDAQETGNGVTSKLKEFDFSHTSHLGLVHSIGGSHQILANSRTLDLINYFSKQGITTTRSRTDISSRSPTGLFSLAQSVNDLGLSLVVQNITQIPRLDFITSSLGDLKPHFLHALLWATCGQTEKLRETKKTSVSENTSVSDLEISSIPHDKYLKVYFPSDKTVRQSRGGPKSAHTICFQSKWWNQAARTKFPVSSMHDCVGKRRDGILMHSKVLYVRYPEPRATLGDAGSSQRGPSATIHGAQASAVSRSLQQLAGWVYIGSANLSASAWGSMETDNKTQEPKFRCRNWECGVIVPVPLSTEAKRLISQGKTLPEMTLEQVFGETVPVPIVEPAESYVEQALLPWFFNS